MHTGLIIEITLKAFQSIAMEFSQTINNTYWIDLQVDNESDNCVTGSMDLKKNVPLCHIVYIIMDEMSFITHDVEKY